MDDIDRQQERDEILHEAFIAARKKEAPPATGRCLSCEEPVLPPRRWCDAACRDDYEKLNPS